MLIRGDVGNEPSVGAVSAEKNYILDARKCVSFLEPLGICDGNGRVYDKKQSKYRQINRFTELLDDVYAKLPSEGELNVCDLCCGKSYLSFAVYYYLTSIKGRIVRMYGVDLKKDVIEFCSGLAERLGFEGMTFECGDVLNFNAVDRPDLVISLHACDIATDYVLAYAIRHKAGLILSTPCCHHEVFNQLSFPKNNTLKPEKDVSVPDLSFLADNSILKSKLSDALTDSLRCLMLEAEGYKTEAVELIDPEETPKNVMIRAVYAGRKNAKALKDYYQAQKFFGLETTLSKLLENVE